MGHMGHYSIGEQILGSYEVGKHGDPMATHESNSNADIPGYAHGFYSLSHFESFSEVVYSKVEIGYDKDARAFDEGVRGAPLELYTPRESLPDPGSSSPSLHAGKSPETEEIVMKHPPKEIIAEILKAQQQVMLDIEEIEVEELIIKRKVKKRKVALRSIQKE